MRRGARAPEFLARRRSSTSAAVARRARRGKLRAYVCDFPTRALLEDHPKVVALPHLGASTGEAEENCAIMVADNAARFPRERQHPQFRELSRGGAASARGRTASPSPTTNVPNMVGQISTCLAARETQHRGPAEQVARRTRVHDHRSRRGRSNAEVLARIRSIDGVLAARVLPIIES